MGINYSYMVDTHVSPGGKTNAPVAGSLDESALHVGLLLHVKP